MRVVVTVDFILDVPESSIVEDITTNLQGISFNVPQKHSVTDNSVSVEYAVECVTTNSEKLEN